MIISNSNNFVVTRAPKTGGTSLAMYILQSGLADGENDRYELEGGFNNWQEFKAFSDANNNLEYTQLPPELYKTEHFKKVNVTFQELVDSGETASDMPCLGIIRHPLEWLSSLFYYANVRRKIMAEQSMAKHGELTDNDKLLAERYATPESAHDFILSNLSTPLIQNILKPQTDYYPEHAQLFNFENVHEHACKFISDKGKNAPEAKIELRKSSHDPTEYIAGLSDYYKERALRVFEKDLIAWEKAYAVYN